MLALVKLPLREILRHWARCLIDLTISGLSWIHAESCISWARSQLCCLWIFKRLEHHLIDGSHNALLVNRGRTPLLNRLVAMITQVRLVLDLVCTTFRLAMLAPMLAIGVSNAPHKSIFATCLRWSIGSIRLLYFSEWAKRLCARHSSTASIQRWEALLLRR